MSKIKVVRRGLIVLLTLCTILATSCSKQEEEIVLKFASWRLDDESRINEINAEYKKIKPNVTIEFVPVKILEKVVEYNDQLETLLRSEVGADVVYLMSFELGENIYKKGLLLPLNNEFPELKDFPKVAVDAWTSKDRTIYGVPAAGVAHGVYYRKDIFNKYGLEEPETWSDFIKVCETLKNNGEVPISQGSIPGWTLYEIVFSGLGATFYKGEEGRRGLIDGSLKFTDKPFMSAFKSLYDLKKYFPEDYKTLDYAVMQQRFGSGNAAMFIGGSWDISIFSDFGLKDKIGWFPPPKINKNDKTQLCFHTDAAFGINKKSRHLKEAIEYVKWTASPEYAQLFMDKLPGFFSYTPGDHKLNNELAKKMIDVIGKSDVTIRTTWDKLSAQEPSGNVLMREALIKMYNDEFTPEETANYIQTGIDSWYIAK